MALWRVGWASWWGQLVLSARTCGPRRPRYVSCLRWIRRLLEQVVAAVVVAFASVVSALARTAPQKSRSVGKRRRRRRLPFSVMREDGGHNPVLVRGTRAGRGARRLRLRRCSRTASRSRGWARPPPSSRSSGPGATRASPNSPQRTFPARASPAPNRTLQVYLSLSKSLSLSPQVSLSLSLSLCLTSSHPIAQP